MAAPGLCAQVVPPLELTPEQLAQHDGSDASKPLYLALCGVVLDVTPGGRAGGLPQGGDVTVYRVGGQVDGWLPSAHTGAIASSTT